VRAAGDGLWAGSSRCRTRLVRHAYLRALGTRRPAATARWTGASAGASSSSIPSRGLDTADVVAVLAAELDPQAIYRVASASGVLDTIPGGAITHALFGPDNVRLSSYQVVPDGWQRVYRSVRVADTVVAVEVAYPVPDLRIYRAERLATWVAGLALALAMA
jgi:hypothetical protein